MGEDNYNQAVAEISIILQTAGYNCETVDEAFHLFCTKNNKCVIVLCSDNIDSLMQFDKTPYSINIDGSKIRCDKIIFSRNTMFSPNNSILWNLDKLLSLIATAAAARICGLPFDIDTFTATAPIHEKTEATDNSQETLEIDRMLPIRYDAKTAICIAHQEGPTTLQLIPYWKYSYQSQGNASYKGKRVTFDSEGTKWINGVNGTEGEFGDDAVPVSGKIDADTKIINPKLQKKDAEKMILASLIEMLTKRISINTTAGETVFTEEKIFKPNKDDINLKVDMVYVPIWEICGKKDFIEVNAFTGEVLDLPSDEGIEIY